MADRIPEEVVAHILSFLSVSDRKNAALVCIKWYHASRYPSLLRDTVAAVLFSQGNVSTVPRHWYGSLVNVSFRGVDLGSSDFVAFLTACPMLQSLDLSGCDNLLLCGDQHFLAKPLDIERLQSTLTKLQSINLSFLRHLTDATFNKIVAIAVNLTSLNLTGCPISFMTTEYSASRSNCLLSFGNIMNYIRSHSHQLHTLYFNQTNMSDHALIELGSVLGLRMSAIFLDKCNEVTPKGVLRFAKVQTELEVFSLAGNNEMTSSCVSSLIATWHSLKVLDLTQNARLGPDFLSALSRSPRRLVSLALTSNSLSEEKLLSAVSSPNLAQMRVLRLGHCSGVTDAVVEALCRCLPDLRVLELSSAFHITDNAITAICTGLDRLQVLNLRWCRAVTDIGFLHALPNGDKSPPFSHFTLLRDLDLSQTEVGDALLIACPPLLSLQRLSLDGNRRVTDHGLSALAKKAPSIEELNLSMATITDEGLLSLLPHLVRLRALHVASCDHISDAIFPALLKHCPDLRELNVSFCGGLTGSGVDAFESRAPKIRHINRRLVSV